MYHSAKCNEYYQPIIKITEGKAEVNIKVNDKFFHSANAVHGSVYFKMLDDAGFFAANSIVEETLVLTASFNIYLLRPITSGNMRAEGRVVNVTGSSIIAESVLYDDNGKEAARGSGNFIKSKIQLIIEMGYKN